MKYKASQEVPTNVDNSLLLGYQMFVDVYIVDISDELSSNVMFVTRVNTGEQGGLSRPYLLVYLLGFVLPDSLSLTEKGDFISRCRVEKTFV